MRKLISRLVLCFADHRQLLRDMDKAKTLIKEQEVLLEHLREYKWVMSIRVAKVLTEVNESLSDGQTSRAAQRRFHALASHLTTGVSIPPLVRTTPAGAVEGEGIPAGHGHLPKRGYNPRPEERNNA